MEQEVMQSLINGIETDKVGFVEAFEILADDGICPALINDDFGHWAVTFEGYQQVPDKPGEPCDIDSSFFLQASHWEKTIKGALLNALKRD